MTTATPGLLTVDEAMARLKYGRSKVYDLIRSKRLASFTEGRCRRIPESAIQDYIRDRIEEAA
ncbi:helix-turn-helix domain-containing protein [Streptomyces sp. NPDC056696]|uniref:helix-turn-helix domain-containing protein n=1 Tax=Streptomyces sp. NPDC056696 TaxID=3345914 RepID=UPI0036CF2242